MAERDGTIKVIQCKRWGQHKLIHEKHIFQLFGTMIAAQIENPGKTVTGTFPTTTALSERAREFARVLEIRVEENFPIADYPRIKCNIARRTGERIYHLPFDQQYDTTVVETTRGELYAATCGEAEAAGFRRAWRWRGETSYVGLSVDLGVTSATVRGSGKSGHMSDATRVPPLATRPISLPNACTPRR